MLRSRSSELLKSVPVWAWLVHSVIVFAAAALAVAFSPGRDTFRPEASGLSRYLINPLSLWDGAWYQQIAAKGYDDRNAAAFWPMFPLLIRSISELLRIPLDLAGVLASNALFLAALWLLHRLVLASYGRDVANRSVWLLALCPVSFFFSAVYTESLFLALMLASVVTAREGRWTLAALALFLTTLTRSAGVLVAVPLVIEAINQYGWNIRRLARPGIWIGIACLGPIVYAAHLDRRWGDPLLMVEAQENWSRLFSWPWDTLWTGFRRTELIYINARHTCLDVRSEVGWIACRDALQLNVGSLNDDLATLGLLLAIGIILLAGRRLILGDLGLLAVLMLFPLFTVVADDPFGSMPRYLLVTYPLFICAAHLLERHRLYLAVLISGAATCFWLTTVFARAWFVA